MEENEAMFDFQGSDFELVDLEDWLKISDVPNFEILKEAEAEENADEEEVEEELAEEQPNGTDEEEELAEDELIDMSATAAPADKTKVDPKGKAPVVAAKPKSNTTMIVIIVVVVMLLVSGLGAFFIFRKRGDATEGGKDVYQRFI